MKFSIISFIVIAGTTTASPVVRNARVDRGSYTVSRLGSRKQHILNTGGNTLDLAIAMLETDNMSANYVYGDGKAQDAANFSIFEEDWARCVSAQAELASRDRVRPTGTTARSRSESCSPGKHVSRTNVDGSSDLYADVASRWDCQNYYGYDKCFAGHRSGASGLADPSTADVNSIRGAENTQQQPTSLRFSGYSSRSTTIPGTGLMILDSGSMPRPSRLKPLEEEGTPGVRARWSFANSTIINLVVYLVPIPHFLRHPLTVHLSTPIFLVWASVNYLLALAGPLHTASDPVGAILNASRGICNASRNRPSSTACSALKCLAYTSSQRSNYTTDSIRNAANRISERRSDELDTGSDAGFLLADRHRGPW